MTMTLWTSQKEKRREYARFLLAFVFIGFLMKIAGELIHEMGHSLMVMIFGGRVLNVVGLGRSLNDAVNHTYSHVDKFFFDGVFYRTDIGFRGMKYLEKP